MLTFPSNKFAFETTKTIQNAVIVHRSGRGKRKTMTNRAYPVYEIKVSLVGITQEEMEGLVGFLAAVKGEPFLFRDFEDYAQYGVTIGAGNGVATQFQLVRSWQGLFYEPIQDVVANTLVVYLNDAKAKATLLNDGIIRFDSPPGAGAIIKADYEYYWRVAIDGDVDWSTVFYNLYKLNSIKLVTV